MKGLAVLPCCTVDAPKLAEQARVALADRLKALADPTRIGEPVCVCNLTDAFGLSQPTISHHLKVLRETGLVEAEKRGTWSYYRLNRNAVAELALALSP